jgi:hypothetical protein
VILRQPTLEQVQDLAVRESLQWFLDYLSDVAILQGEWKYFEQTFNFTSSTQTKIAHGLPFIPKDVIQTALVKTTSSTPTVQFDFELFDRTHIYITTTQPCVVRFFLGRHRA